MQSLAMGKYLSVMALILLTSGMVHISSGRFICFTDTPYKNNLLAPDGDQNILIFCVSTSCKVPETEREER